jgi:hypothetical protein
MKNAQSRMTGFVAQLFYFRSNNDTRHCTRYAAVHNPVLMYEIIQSIGKKWQDFMPKIELQTDNLTVGDYLDIYIGL